MGESGGASSLLDKLQPGFDQELLGLLVALALGLLVGLEREWDRDNPLGARSFASIALLGGVAVLLIPTAGPWVLLAGLLALALLLGRWVQSDRPSGLTTVLAAPVVFLLGAAAVAGLWLQAVVVTGVLTLLLHWKQPIHALVRRFDPADMETVARFVLITLVILPVLPDRSYGPYGFFNPFRTWLLVVLIVAINLSGFVAVRMVGGRAGGWVAGLLGGMVSSTATTVGYANLSRRQPKLGPQAALVVLLASTVVYPRMLLELGVVAPELVGAILWPAVVFASTLLALALLVHWRAPVREQAKHPDPDNPAGLAVALSFGALYLLLLLAVSGAREMLGEEALYAVALVSGLMDVDALTLSIGELFAEGRTSADTAWRAIFLASLANLLFKTGAAAVIGPPELRRWIVPCGLVALLCGALLMLLWP